MGEYDVGVIGGGIVGLATALQYLRLRPDSRLLLLEKESTVAIHQTGHNSGVVHAGIYYPPGSAKARLCREGLTATQEFCQTYNLPYQNCGKLIVATNAEELQRLDALYERARENGVNLQYVNQDELHEIEPDISGVAALLSPDTAITDYRCIAQKMTSLIRDEYGGDLVFGQQVNSIRETSSCVEISTAEHHWQVKKLIVCAGLQADRLAMMAGIKVNFRIVPFRGEYYYLPADYNKRIQHLIYPVPDPALPFLGVHLTLTVAGNITTGPNAVLSLAREGYKKTSCNIRDTLNSCLYPGFWKLILQHPRHVWGETKSFLSRAEYLKECRKYCPQLSITDLQSWYCGIRAQVVTKEGEAIHDFAFGETKHQLHIFNAPSPAATAALPIGRMIASRCLGLE